MPSWRMRHADADLFAQLDTWRRVVHMSSLRDWAFALPSQGRFTFTTAAARAASGWRIRRRRRRGPGPGRGRSPHRVAGARLPRGAPPRGPRDRDAVVAAVPRSPDDAPRPAVLRGPPHGGSHPRGLGPGGAGHPGGHAPSAATRAVGRLVIEFVVRRRRPGHPSSCGRRRRAGCAWRPRSSSRLDLVRYPARAAGWGNVATVLRDLAPSLRRAGMRAALAVEPTAPELQRLGHLLERAGAEAVARRARGRARDPAGGLGAARPRRAGRVRRGSAGRALARPRQRRAEAD